MAALIGVLSLLSALAATGSALSCTQCISESSSCTGGSMTCPSGQLCGTAYTEIIAGGGMNHALVRTCSPSSECNIKGSVTIQGRQIRMVTSCCDTDGCTPTLPTLPTKNSTPNGLVCRSCISADSTWCYTSDTVQCTGDENRCLLQTTQVSGQGSSASAAIRGCATKSICDLGSQSQSIGDVSAKVKAICTSDGTSVHKNVLASAVACLLLLKLFF